MEPAWNFLSPSSPTPRPNPLWPGGWGGCGGRGRGRISHYDQVELTPGMQGWLSILQKAINVIHHINERRNKNDTIVSDAEKALDRIQHLFKIKTLNKLEVEGNFLYLIKNL